MSEFDSDREINPKPRHPDVEKFFGKNPTFDKKSALVFLKEKVKNKPGSDPNGIDQHSPGAKLDSDKIMPGLVFEGFANALEEASKVATFGALKYTRDGWKHVPDGITRYTEAFYRHLLQHGKGEKVDSESGLTHLGHALWNLMAIVELRAVQERRKETGLPNGQASD